jgi:Zn-dependent peptidase ImmA (M78 family)/DNA-binding XRE family transcriptional regulator
MATDAASIEHLAGRLRLARRDEGLTQEEVASKLDVARTTIVAIEKGERQVRPDELRNLARILNRPVDELLRPAPAVEDLDAQFRLVLPKTGQDKELETAVRAVEQLVDDYVELERLAQATPQRRYPTETSIVGLDVEVAAAELAQTERLRLGLGDAPISKVRDVLEGMGVRVFALTLPSNVGGLFAHDDRAGACIAFNSAHTFERQQMSLTHEWGHLLVDRRSAGVAYIAPKARRSRNERFAVTFAYEILMPASSVTRHFNDLKRTRGGGVTVADLVGLAFIFCVSVEAMFHRLESLRLISLGTYERVRHEGLKVAEVQEVVGISPPQPDTQLLPRGFLTLAISSFQSGAITEGLFARLLRLDRVEARRLARELDGDTQLLA